MDSTQLNGPFVCACLTEVRRTSIGNRGGTRVGWAWLECGAGTGRGTGWVEERGVSWPEVPGMGGPERGLDAAEGH